MKMNRRQELQVLSNSLAWNGLLFIEYEDVVKEIVCSTYGVSEHELSSKSRLRSKVYARFTCYHILRRKDNKKYTSLELGKIFNKDHATILHGLKEFDKLMDKRFGQQSFRDNFKVIKKRLEEYNNLIK